MKGVKIAINIVILIILIYILASFVMGGKINNTNGFNLNNMFGMFLHSDRDFTGYEKIESELELTDKIKSLYVSRISGEIEILPSKDDKIHITLLNSPRVNTETMYKVKNGKLYIETKTEKGKIEHIDNSIAIEIPNQLDNIDLDVVSNQVIIESDAKNLDIDGVDAGIDIKGEYENIDIDVVGGIITFINENKFKNVEIDCVSADVFFHYDITGIGIELDTVSGYYENQFNDEIIKGEIDIKGSNDKKIAMDSVSGRIIVLK